MSEDSTDKNKEAWLEAVRRKTQQSSCQLPADSWEAIAKAAGITTTPAPKRHARLRLWTALGAAAAAIVLIVGVATLGVRMEPTVGRPQTTAGAVVAAADDDENSGQKTVQEPMLVAQTIRAVAGGSHSQTAATREGLAGQEQQTQNGVASEATEQVTSPTDADNGLEAAKVNEQCESGSGIVNASGADNAKSTDKDSWRSGRGYRGNLQNGKSAQKRSGVAEGYGNAIRLYGNGVILAKAEGQTPGRVQMVMASSDGMIYAAPRATNFHYDHKIPVTVGLSFSKSLPYNLELSSGLVYTSMSSDVTAELTGEKFTQRVQLLGIPLGVRWNFWHWRHFDTYLGGEALAEKVIEAKRGDEKIDASRVQWSLHALAGVRYNIGDHFGVYVEPKLSRYISDLPLTTVRDEHDLHLNVQFGLSVKF